MSMALLVPSLIQQIFNQIREKGFPFNRSDFSEEEQSIVQNFTEEIEIFPVEVDAEVFDPIEVGSVSDEVTFEAFLDGVQRTVMLPYRISLPNGALVPIHIAHIAAGIVLRERGRLYTQSNLIASRLLLLGPFKGIEEAGGPRIEISDREIIWDTDDRTFSMPQEINEWIVCDTTFRGTDIDRERYREGALLDRELFNEGLVRSRAQGRVATLRQRLEFAVLAEFRAQEPRKWILVDGPLFFIDKWSQRAVKVLGNKLNESQEGPFEGKLLEKAVGLIKTHRLRPKHPEKVLQIGPFQRSPVLRLLSEVDIKGKKDSPDEGGNYMGAHLTWYTRLRGRSEPPYGLLGLVRVDVHRSTFGIERVDELRPETFVEYRPLVNAITRAVWRERWPALRGALFNTGSLIYPIYQVERVLKSMVYPKRLLAHLLV